MMAGTVLFIALGASLFPTYSDPPLPYHVLSIYLPIYTLRVL